jgi:hypothetical protein
MVRHSGRREADVPSGTVSAKLIAQRPSVRGTVRLGTGCLIK